MKLRKALKILLVDDEVLPAMAMEGQLRASGCEITEIATTAEKAIRSVKESPPDLVLMDIRWAGRLDGIDAATAIRAESKIPIIFLSGYGDRATRERANAIAPLAFLTKPIDLVLLERTIDGHFR
jgi:two-component system, response regulator PdtaR